MSAPRTRSGAEPRHDRCASGAGSGASASAARRPTSRCCASCASSGAAGSSADEFEDAIAACNLLPGPASTQLAIYCAWRLRGARRRARRRRRLHRPGAGPDPRAGGALPRLAAGRGCVARGGGRAPPSPPWRCRPGRDLMPAEPGNGRDGAQRARWVAYVLGRRAGRGAGRAVAGARAARLRGDRARVARRGARPRGSRRSRRGRSPLASQAAGGLGALAGRRSRSARSPTAAAS